MKLATGFLTAAIAAILTGTVAFAQPAPVPKTTSDATAAKPTSEGPPARINVNIYPVQTVYLKNATQQADANEIITALRNTLPPDDKVFPVLSQNAVLIRASPEDVALAQKMVNELDRPKKNYRLTYTVTEMDGGKPMGVQHYAIILLSGQTTTLKQGSRVPLVTGSYNAVPSDKTPAGVQTQVTYIDIGMNFDATLTATGDGAMLKSSVEQSSVAPETSGVGPQDPILRQTSLRGVSFLAPGKPLALGSLDIPGSTSHLQIEVVMEPLP